MREHCRRYRIEDKKKQDVIYEIRNISFHEQVKARKGNIKLRNSRLTMQKKRVFDPKYKAHYG